MDETNASSQKDFPEWMVTQALARHLGESGKENPQRMAWLFGLEAQTPDGNRKLRDLCGFDWAAEQVCGGAEEAFKEKDKGKLSSEEFRQIFWTITPDFRYWTRQRDRQLIIEAKGTSKPIGQRDREQAKRYFAYLQKSDCKGAVIYFAPNPVAWLTWLEDIGKKTIPEQDSGICFGVVDLKVQVVPRVASELVDVVGKALVQTADLLKEALRFSKTA